MILLLFVVSTEHNAKYYQNNCLLFYIVWFMTKVQMNLTSLGDVLKKKHLCNICMKTA